MFDRIFIITLKGGSMGKSESGSTFGLIVRFFSLVRSFFSKEKLFVKQIAQEAVKTGIPALILGIAGAVLVALAGIFSLVTLVLLLNTWFLPWVSALIVTTILLLSGLILGLTGLRLAQKKLGKVRTDLIRAREDMRWLKRN
jgi:uncharacterized membrane protein YqjE